MKKLNRTSILSSYFNLCGREIVILVLLSLFSVLFEALGIGLFIPLLNGSESGSYAAQFMEGFIRLLGMEGSLSNILITLCIVMTIRSIFFAANALYTNYIQRKLLINLQTESMESLQRVEYKSICGKNPGHIANSLTQEFQRVVSGFKMVANSITGTVFCFIYFIFLTALNVYITLAAISAIIPFIVIYVLANRRIKDAAHRMSAIRGDMSALIVESIQHIKYFKSTSSFCYVKDKVNALSKKLSKSLFWQKFVMTISNEGSVPFITVMVSLIVIAQVYHFNITVAGSLFFALVFKRFCDQILNTYSSYQKLLTIAGPMKVYKKVTEELRESSCAEDNDGIKISEPKSIYVEKLTFSYQSETSADHIFNFASMILEKDKITGLIGGSGSGKSTLSSLITGILKAQEGGIRIGNVYLKEANLDEYRTHIGYVMQENILLNDTVRNNLLLGSKSVSDDSLLKVLDKVGMKNVIESLPDSLESKVYFGGSNLSMGQRQRLCVARELLKEPYLMIFDEATSALDPASEDAVLDSINRIKGKFPILLITHKEKPLKICDDVYEIRSGKILKLEKVIPNV